MRDAMHLLWSGERFLIHTGKGMTRGEYEEALATAHEIGRIKPFPAGLTLPPADELPRGAIVGSARIAGIGGDKAAASPWFFGPIGIVLADVRAFPEPIPCKGALGFFVPQGHQWPTL